MKSIYKSLIATLILLSMILSASSCVFNKDANKNGSSDTVNNEKTDNTDTTNPTTEENKNNENDDSDTTNTPGGNENGSTVGGGQEEGEKNPEENTGGAEGGGGTGNEGGSSDDEDNTDGSEGNENAGNSENEGGSNADDGFVPDMTKENTITDTHFPRRNYAYLAENAYNKNLFYKNSYEIPLGDPSVFVKEENGETWFYVTGTTSSNKFEMWKTKNFTDWKKVGTIYSPGENFFGKSSFWAPQLYYDAEADWQYYLGESSESGKGLYILFFSARKSNNVCALSVAFSKNIEGPYKNFKGTNANGDYVDETCSVFDVEKLRGLGLYSDHAYGDLYKKNRSFIDASPFVDPITADKYLFMVRNRVVDTSNDVWGVKMKDWVTPDYSTTTPLTSNGYTDINKTEQYGYISTNKIDEGPFLYYKDYTDDGIENGKYYLTFSIGDTNDKIYPVCQAIADSPLGPFTKVQPQSGGMLNFPEHAWDIHGSGHHSFFEANGELYIAYHTYEINSGNSIGRRYFAFDRIEWVYNDLGQYVMRSNGPSVTIQPLPSAASGYTNVARDAIISTNTNADNTELLNDGIVASRYTDTELIFSFAERTVITLSFPKYVTARAIMIYNSFDFSTAFLGIDKIELSYRTEIDGRLYFGTAIIDNMDFNIKNNSIPKDYLEAQGETNLNQLRPGSSSIVEFGEIEIKSVTIYISNRNGEAKTAISEIVILGKEGKTYEDESIGFGGYTSPSPFETYTDFDGTMSKKEKSPEELVTIDGNLNEMLWQKHATETVINGATVDSETKKPVDVSLYGERKAKVYTYIGETKIFFAFSVTDKNLYFNSSQPQGRSTCIEIYFTTASNTSLKDNCYSIRINPTGKADELSCNIGVYVGNESGTEWRWCEIAHNVKAISKVNGSVQTTANQNGYDPSLNTGYTVEIEIDKILIGVGADSFRFTAAFVQDRGYNDPRIGNSFIVDTHYTRPQTWIVFKNKEVN